MANNPIQWFPGHMAKTRRVMKECLPEVDLVLELLDARIPKSSRNPEIEKMLGLVELNIDEFYNFYQDKKIKNAVNYAKDLKDRYTVLWLNYDLYGEA